VRRVGLLVSIFFFLIKIASKFHTITTEILSTKQKGKFGKTGRAPGTFPCKVELVNEMPSTIRGRTQVA